MKHDKIFVIRFNNTKDYNFKEIPSNYLISALSPTLRLPPLHKRYDCGTTSFWIMRITVGQTNETLKWGIYIYFPSYVFNLF